MPHYLPAALPLLLAAVALAEPYDKCGQFVAGLEGCIVFQPDDNSPRVLPDLAMPAVGTRGRLRGEHTQCASFCFTSCVQSASLAACQTPTPCAPDFDGSGTLAPADIFAFLDAWFAGAPTADFNHSGALSAQDIFDFLMAWFSGCP